MALIFYVLNVQKLGSWQLTRNDVSSVGRRPRALSSSTQPRQPQCKETIALALSLELVDFIVLSLRFCVPLVKVLAEFFFILVLRLFPSSRLEVLRKIYMSFGIRLKTRSTFKHIFSAQSLNLEVISKSNAGLAE